MPFQLNFHQLNGKTYMKWAQSEKAYNRWSWKYRTFDGSDKKPGIWDPNMIYWRLENSLMISWLIRYLKSVIGKYRLFCPTAKDVWEAIRETYFDVRNASEIFKLKNKLWKAKQGEKEVTVYYNEMMSLLQELD